MHHKTHQYEMIREGLSVPEACYVAGIGRTKLYELLSNGQLRAHKLGRRIIIMRRDLEDFMASLPAMSPHQTDVANQLVRKAKGIGS